MLFVCVEEGVAEEQRGSSSDCRALPFLVWGMQSLIYDGKALERATLTSEQICTSTRSHRLIGQPVPWSMQTPASERSCRAGQDR
jgi:hypothetical protein